MSDMWQIINKWAELPIPEMLMSSLLSQGLKCSTCIQKLSPFCLFNLINKCGWSIAASEVLTSVWKAPHITHICEVLLSLSGADHIQCLCKMHFGSCAISHDYQSKRYEKLDNLNIFNHKSPVSYVILFPFHLLQNNQDQVIYANGKSTR